jgi:hypothetical protein
MCVNELFKQVVHVVNRLLNNRLSIENKVSDSRLSRSLPAMNACKDGACMRLPHISTKLAERLKFIVRDPFGELTGVNLFLRPPD